jgi:hypothetical protein
MKTDTCIGFQPNPSDIGKYVLRTSALRAVNRKETAAMSLKEYAETTVITAAISSWALVGYQLIQFFS